jgi:SWI/SNF-related matrix-associated actin-dependent regulator of chromatin subfamily A3
MILITNTKLTTHSVVFSCWTSTLDLITSALRLRSIAHARIDGAVAMNKRQSAIALFKEDPTTNILLLTLASGASWCVETQDNRYLD